VPLVLAMVIGPMIETSLRHEEGGEQGEGLEREAHRNPGDAAERQDGPPVGQPDAGMMPRSGVRGKIRGWELVSGKAEHAGEPREAGCEGEPADRARRGPSGFLTGIPVPA
jgi:hypothetical protein